MSRAPSAVEALCSDSVSARIPVPFVTERLELRPFQEEDVERFAALMADDEATMFIGGPKSPAAAADSVRYMRDAFAARGWGTLAVVQRNDKACIGYCGVRPLLNTPNVELAFALERRSWGRGYATEASKASLDLAFRNLAIDSVFATVYPDNHASIKVLTKVGMLFQRTIFGAWPRSSALLYKIERSTS